MQVPCLFAFHRVATLPGEPGKVRKLDISPKSQGISSFYSKSWKSPGIQKNFKT